MKPISLHQSVTLKKCFILLLSLLSLLFLIEIITAFPVRYYRTNYYRQQDDSYLPFDIVNHTDNELKIYLCRIDTLSEGDSGESWLVKALLKPDEKSTLRYFLGNRRIDDISNNEKEHMEFVLLVLYGGNNSIPSNKDLYQLHIMKYEDVHNILTIN